MCPHLRDGIGFGANVAAQEHYGFSVEDAVLAASLTEGYRLAIERLHDEATQIGAHGVVGVDLFFENLVGSPGTATFFARGTAVTHPGTPPLPSPFLTNASGQHFERLIALGYVPTGLAVGCREPSTSNPIARPGATSPFPAPTARSRRPSPWPAPGHGQRWRPRPTGRARAWSTPSGPIDA